MIHPLSTTNITGILWYQGEGDVNNESQDYSIMLEALLKLFENIFNTDEIPVFLVQIPYFSNYKSSYLLGRLNSYQYCFSIENSNAEIIAINDTIPDFSNLHLKRKQKIGEKIADLILNKIYCEEINQNYSVFQGPEVKKIDSGSNSVVIHFDHCGSGLKTWDNKPLTGFEVADEDGVFVNCSAVINGSIVKITSSSIESPAYIRAGFNNNGLKIFNLANLEGYSAPAFLFEIYE